MKVRMLTPKAGHARPQMGIPDTFSYETAELVDIHEDLAKAWIASGSAEALKSRSKDAPEKEEK